MKRDVTFHCQDHIAHVRQNKGRNDEEGPIQHIVKGECVFDERKTAPASFSPPKLYSNTFFKADVQTQHVPSRISCLEKSSFHHVQQQQQCSVVKSERVIAHE